MKTIEFRLLFAAGAVALVGFYAPAPADADTCASACNQIRRACTHVAKAVRKVEFAFCDDDRDACRVTCEADSGACAAICATAHADCSAGCATSSDPAVCQAACDAALVACPTECPECCNFNRDSCRDTVKAARAAARLVCADTRATCNDTCTGVDGDCVRQCMRDQRECTNGWKKTAITCKRNCNAATSRRACMRMCHRQMNEAFQLCSQAEALCVADECITTSP